jgi:hypothetical protein
VAAVVSAGGSRKKDFDRLYFRKSEAVIDFGKESWES